MMTRISRPDCHIKYFLAACLAFCLSTGCDTNKTILARIKAQTPALRSRLEALKTQGIHTDL